MTKVISTQTKTFKFTDEFSQSTSAHYLSTITVKELEYEDGNHYWDIEYVNKFIPGTIDSPVIINSREKKSHPFYGSQVPDFMEYQGDILFKNPMTSIMVKYL